jgi:hypothetical protein
MPVNAYAARGGECPLGRFSFLDRSWHRGIRDVSRGEISPEALAFSKLTPESTLSLDAGPRRISTCRGLRLGPTDRLLQRLPAGGGLPGAFPPFVLARCTIRGFFSGVLTVRVRRLRHVWRPC